MSASGFDRLRPRSTPVQPEAPAPAAVPGQHDAQGKRALFSTEAPVPALGSVVIECSACGESSVVGLRQALRAALPSLHLPVIRRDHPSLMRCPACGHRTWVKASIRL